jgi:hypothetical protein
MFNYKETLQKMRRERASMQAEIDKFDQAIAALQVLAGKAAPARTKSGLSAKARRGASHNNLGKTAKKKRKISAEGLKNIIRAQNKRWAKVRAAAKAKTKANAAAGKV